VESEPSEIISRVHIDPDFYSDFARCSSKSSSSWDSFFAFLLVVVGDCLVVCSLECVAVGNETSTAKKMSGIGSLIESTNVAGKRVNHDPLGLGRFHIF